MSARGGRAAYRKTRLLDQIKQTSNRSGAGLLGKLSHDDADIAVGDDRSHVSNPRIDQARHTTAEKFGELGGSAGGFGIDRLDQHSARMHPQPETRHVGVIGRDKLAIFLGYLRNRELLADPVVLIAIDDQQLGVWAYSLDGAEQG